MVLVRLGKILYKLENIPVVVRHIEPLQHLDVFFFEACALVMRLLILNISDYRAELRMGIGKSAEPLLPRESAYNPTPIINEPGRGGLYVAD